MLDAALFHGRWPLIVYFEFCILFYVGSGSKSVSGTEHGIEMYTGSSYS
jgi:hypothetical protein